MTVFRRALPALLLLAPAAAYAVANVCDIDGRVAGEETAFPAGAGAPSYFIHVMPDSNEVMWIDGTRSGNHIMRTGAISASTRRETQIPGTIDPVADPDGWVMTTPDPGMDFYDMAAVRRGPAADGTFAPPLLEDSDINGVYQSIGTLSRSNGTPRTRGIRIMSDQDGMSFREYTLTRTGATGPVSVATAGPVVRMCANLGTANFVTPRLSKDGRYVAALDQRTQTTKILSVADDGSCAEVADLGMRTGKVDFDFSNNRISFHVDAYSHDPGYFSGVSGSMSKDIYVATLDKGSGGAITGVRDLRRLTTHTRPGTGSYYPAWRRDGRLVYVNQERATDGSLRYSFVQVNPSDVEPVTYFADSCHHPRHANAVHVLAALWGQVCPGALDSGASQQDASLAVLSLNPDACKAMVKREWPIRMEDVLNDSRLVGAINTAPESRPGITAALCSECIDEITEADLLAACPKKRPVKALAKKHVVVGPTVAAKRATGGQLLHQRCFGCHADGLRLEGASRDRINTVLGRVRARSMPPGNPLESSERDEIIRYLEGL